MKEAIHTTDNIDYAIPNVSDELRGYKPQSIKFYGGTRYETCKHMIHKLDIASTQITSTMRTILNYPELYDELMQIREDIEEVITKLEDIQKDIPIGEIGWQI